MTGDSPDGFPGRVRRALARVRAAVGRFAGAGPAHRARLARADVRIAVAGVRGKTSAVRWLHDVLVRRGLDTYAKVTGTEPASIHNGERRPVERSVRTTLYENERELRRVAPVEAVVVENQGIREYTTRLVNARYVDPHVVLVTNVRADHLDTLGSDRRYVARALARAVPADTPVVCGEQDPTLREYFATEAARRDAAVTFVDVPDEHAAVPGAECVHGVSAVLESVGRAPLAPAERDALLAELRPAWRRVAGGRVYDATAANDVQSTEAVRRALVGDADRTVQPILCLRRDRRGRTASFRRYLDRLAGRGVVERVRVVGDGARPFARRAAVEVVVHDEREPARDVLAAALADGWPVLLMGNAVPAFSRQLREAVDELAERADRADVRATDARRAVSARDGDANGD